MFRDIIRDAIKHAITTLQTEGALGGFDLPEISVEVPEEPSHGDYATSAPFSISKLARQKPAAIAELVAAKLKEQQGDLFADVRAAEPGFINFFLRDDVLGKSLVGLLEHPDQWSNSQAGSGKTVLVEYFQLNVAKRPHIGHLRSAVIGDALKRMFLAFGYRAVSDTHVGDWGTQFGILLAYVKGELLALPADWNFERELANGDPFSKLEQFYVEGSTYIENYPESRDAAKKEFAKLEHGDPENRRLWKLMLDISMEKLLESAHHLGLCPFEEHKGESSYEDAMPSIVELALRKGVAKKTSDGAVIVDLTAQNLDDAVLVKSDGASTYLLRDLATIQYRKQRWRFSKNLYVVDVRQSHHFKQLFRVAELLGFEGVGESEHIEFGFISLPEGVLSTRAGTAISLDAVITEAKERARRVIEEKNPGLANKDAVAEAVGIGALKYFDLSHHRKSDIVFRWDEALSFDGNTGPYLQYTHARLKSILRKVGSEKIKNIEKIEMDRVEHQLLTAMLQLPETIEDALVGYAPNVLANYLYNLAKLANEFYHSHPVSQESDEAKRELRTAIVAGVATTLARGLKLLGIEAPEEM